MRNLVPFFEKLVIHPIFHVIHQKNDIEDILYVMFIQIMMKGNNGISDIIDGVSNGKYQPSYGHGDGYWEENSSRLANEAFAQFFSAQMTGDTQEVEKMKELMPETYEIYCKMIQEAAHES